MSNITKFDPEEITRGEKETLREALALFPPTSELAAFLSHVDAYIAAGKCFYLMTSGGPADGVD